MLLRYDCDAVLEHHYSWHFKTDSSLRDILSTPDRQSLDRLSNHMTDDTSKTQTVVSLTAHRVKSLKDITALLDSWPFENHTLTNYRKYSFAIITCVAHFITYDFPKTSLLHWLDHLDV